MTEELASGGGSARCAQASQCVDNSLLKLENDFAAAFALRGMCDCGFDFA